MVSYKKYEALLRENGLKTADVARKTGISQSTFSDWKRGKTVPKADKLYQIAKELNVHVEDLMEVSANEQS